MDHNAFSTVVEKLLNGDAAVKPRQPKHCPRCAGRGYVVNDNEYEVRMLGITRKDCTDCDGKPTFREFA